MHYYDGYKERVDELVDSAELVEDLGNAAHSIMNAEQHELALRITAIYLRSLRELYEFALERRDL